MACTSKDEVLLLGVTVQGVVNAMQHRQVHSYAHAVQQPSCQLYYGCSSGTRCAWGKRLRGNCEDLAINTGQTVCCSSKAGY